MTAQISVTIPGIAWRAMRMDDAEQLHTLVRQSETFDGMPFVTSLDEIHRQLADPESDLATDTIAAVLPDGQLAAFGASRTRADVTHRRALGQDGTVRPDLRRRGLGTAVLAWTEGRSRERHRELGDQVPAFLEVWSNERSEDRRAFFSSRAYQPIRYYDEMRRPLRDEIPSAALSDGLRLERWTSELDEAFREAHNDAFADHWGSEPLSAEMWRHHRSGSPHFRRDLSYGVFEAEVLIGYCLAYHAPEDAQVTGRVDGWLGQIGVRRQWRGRGVATAVMCHVMRGMVEAGMDHACLDVDSQNPTGAVGLYARLAFRTHERWIRWSKPA
ncbi:MAG TPA: GNAT family N-acetyltransferase [Candidatus Caenarcaniphilales bacterium]|nr:GNAT family N-acetyltransferase [Candidatus Caenarcaniphilales bacterium]